MPNHPDVLVIGGGIIGLTAALELTRAGASVEVVDRSDLGREASWAGAGILPPGNPDRAATPIDKLRAIGSAGMPAFAAELRDLTGIDTGYRRCGGVEFLGPGDEYALDVWRTEGIRFERLTGAGLKELEPAVGDVPGEPVVLPDCAQVRNPWHLRALAAACERAGVRLRPNTRVAGWAEPLSPLPLRERAVRLGEPGEGTSAPHEDVPSPGPAEPGPPSPARGEGRNPRVSAVRLADGRTLSAGRVLIAAGAWSEEFLAPLGVRPKVHPVRGQIVLLKTPRPVIRRVLMIGKEYLVPRDDGRTLVGSTEEPEAGFEKANTADAVAKLRALAARAVPALADAEVEKCWAGLRPGSPDGLPFIGPVPGADNVFVAAGHFRAGVQLSLGTARVVTELLTGKPTSVPLAAFRVDRTPNVAGKPAFRS